MGSNRQTGKRLIATGVGAGLLLGGAAGVALTLPTGAFAQDDAPTTEAPAEGRRGGPMVGVLDELVANGTITQEQADTIVGAAEARRAEAHGDGGMGGPGMGGPGRPGADRRGPGGHGPGSPGGRGASLETAAATIGISVEDLRTQLRDGQSLAAIAEANGVSTETLVDALAADAREHITEMVQRVPGEGRGS